MQKLQTVNAETLLYEPLVLMSFSAPQELAQIQIFVDLDAHTPLMGKGRLHAQSFGFLPLPMSSVTMIPKRLASSIGTGIQAIVTSALFALWKSSITS